MKNQTVSTTKITIQELEIRNELFFGAIGRVVKGFFGGAKAVSAAPRTTRTVAGSGWSARVPVRR